ncbi:hypothetical protein DFH09DRAFT_1303009 [Mycena vulgaris]|nr:hypothetical protein DFH09DRAFT_1303009 [Mycena vulgaris]
MREHLFQMQLEQDASVWSITPPPTRSSPHPRPRLQVLPARPGAASATCSRCRPSARISGCGLRAYARQSSRVVPHAFAGPDAYDAHPLAADSNRSATAPSRILTAVAPHARRVWPGLGLKCAACSGFAYNPQLHAAAEECADVFVYNPHLAAVTNAHVAHPVAAMDNNGFMHPPHAFASTDAQRAAPQMYYAHPVAADYTDGFTSMRAQCVNGFDRGFTYSPHDAHPIPAAANTQHDNGVAYAHRIAEHATGFAGTRTQRTRARGRSRAGAAATTAWGEDGEEEGYSLVLIVDAGGVGHRRERGQAMAWEQEGHGDGAEYPGVLVADAADVYHMHPVVSDRNCLAAGYDESGATAALWDGHGDGEEAEYLRVLVVGRVAWGSAGKRNTPTTQKDYASMDADSTSDDTETLHDYGYDEYAPWEDDKRDAQRFAEIRRRRAPFHAAAHPHSQSSPSLLPVRFEGDCLRTRKRKFEAEFGAVVDGGGGGADDESRERDAIQEPGYEQEHASASSLASKRARCSDAESGSDSGSVGENVDADAEEDGGHYEDWEPRRKHVRLER